MGDEGSVSIGVRVKPEVKARLEELARLSERSLSDVMRLLIMGADPADLVPPALRDATPEGEEDDADGP